MNVSERKMRDQAIIVRNARKQYGGGNLVLNGVNLNVPKGCIYGLLGASGCGKTTLLSCIVGVRKLDAGDILVLGGRPGDNDSGIPGPRVGYMPQDISLVDEFSVIGALYFFGKINGLDKETIDERYLFLKDLLQLPPHDRLVKNMSGGQQRRVSFAAALLHKPELLILDEPTVGLDPVLRDNIWNHLVQITQEKQVTIIITTHYIEEAKQANKIGLLRSGQLLAESSPTELLEEWQTDSLEEAFLNLSQLQVQNRLDSRRTSSIANNTITMDLHTSQKMQLTSNWKKRCQALLLKNFYQFVRHPGGILFSFVLPIMQIILFFNSIGLDPKDLKISVVNEEAGNCNDGRNFGNVSYNYNDFSCNFADLSCKFLTEIDDSFLKKVYYDSYEEALDRAQKDGIVAIMHFRRNFSHAMQARLDDYLSLSEEDIVSGQIEVTIQTADRQISIYLQKRLYSVFFDKYDVIMKQCKIVPKFAKLPVNFEEPIFGSMDQTYTSFAAPIFVLLVLFMQATSLSSSIIITDRHSGVWDRVTVQGVTTTEILVTHLATQVFLTILQTTVALGIYFILSDSECKGSVATIMWLSLLGGLCGMCYGFTISVVCTSHTLVNYASVGSFYPLVILTGYLWPVEGMPKVLRWFSLALPLTKPGISIRDVLEKGSSIDEPEVYLGFIVMGAWIAILVSFCMVYLKAKST